MEDKEIIFGVDAKIKNDPNDLSDFFQRPTKTTAEKGIPEPPPVKRNLGTFTASSTQGKDDIYEKMTDESVSEDFDLSSQDLEDFSELIISGIDWIIEKALSYYGKTSVESKMQEKKLARLKLILSKILVKYGLKMKLEFIFIIMLVSYGTSRVISAVPIDQKKKADLKIKDQKLQDKKPNKNRPLG